MHGTPTDAPHRGMLIHRAGGYDLLVWLLTLGREGRFRERLLAPAHLRPGESVLDVGCGTGTLAIAARRVVVGGEVQGVDPSAAMVERARHKAARARVDVRFQSAFVQALPFEDGQFDVVLSTLMLHHVPGDERPAAIAEMRRVLKPGGRLLIVDLRAGGGGHGILSHLHRRRGGVGDDAMNQLVRDAGLEIAESGPLGVWNLQFVVGVRRRG